ncbi:MAG: DUF1611 domain-containing protein [Mangrovibacterium sp.]
MSIFTRNNFKTSAPITKFFDYPRSLDIYGHEKPIQSWFTNQDINEFDTLVVGYFFEHDFQGNVKFGFDLITEMIKADKNLFLFDTELKEIIQKKYLTNKYKGKIYCPEINKETYRDFSTFHFSNKPTTPTLSVIGTSSKQGKFTTQLIIKELLQNKGYKVSHISTEPHGELLGADFSFPMGYNPTVVIPQQQWPDLLRNVTKAVEHYHNPDLILSGIQSWTIPIGYPEITGNEFRSLYFLLGVQPDACICAINPNDSIDYINRCVTRCKIGFKI